MLLLFSALMDEKIDSLKEYRTFINQEVIKSVTEACLGRFSRIS